MPRNYLLPADPSPRSARRLKPWLLASATVGGLAALPLAGVHGQDLFAGQPLPENRFAILGRPVGATDWSLLVLEQVAAAPRCWTARPDGLVDPSLNRFNFTGICNRFIDSNGYSLRIGEQDLASSYRLRLVQVGEELRLQASSAASPSDLLVGRGTVPQRDRDGFVSLTLEPGWSLQRRIYKGRSLSHIYFSNADSLPALLARLQPEPPPLVTASGPVAPARGERGSRLLSRLGSLGSSRDDRAASSFADTAGSRLGSLADRGQTVIPGRPVPLQVIPFRD